MEQNTTHNWCYSGSMCYHKWPVLTTYTYSSLLSSQLQEIHRTCLKVCYILKIVHWSCHRSWGNSCHMPHWHSSAHVRQPWVMKISQMMSFTLVWYCSLQTSVEWSPLCGKCNPFAQEIVLWLFLGLLMILMAPRSWVHSMNIYLNTTVTTQLISNLILPKLLEHSSCQQIAYWKCLILSHSCVGSLLFIWEDDLTKISSHCSGTIWAFFLWCGKDCCCFDFKK